MAIRASPASSAPTAAIQRFVSVLIGCYLYTAIVLVTSQQGEVNEFCEDESFTASCSDKSAVVMVTSAVYGRMRKGRCLSRDDGPDCQADVRRQMARRCTGREFCKVPVTSLLQEGTKPCSKDFRSFLEAGYTCVPVLRGDTAECTQGVSTVTVTGQGYISGYIAVTTNCGTVDHPWLLKAAPGQRINLTLIDYSSLGGGGLLNGGNGRPPSGGRSFPSAADSNVCTVYAIIREPSGGQTRTICGGGTGGGGVSGGMYGGVGEVQEAEVYVSSNNSVEVRIVGRKGSEDDASNNFMIMYQVVGCRDPVVPDGVWFKRGDREAFLGCTSSEQHWTLRCQDGKWIGGDIDRTCSEVPNSAVLVGQEFPTIFKGLSVIVIAAVAIAVGVTILLAGLIYLKRRRRRQFLAERRLADDIRSGYGGNGMKSSHSPAVNTGQRNLKECHDLMYNQSDNNDYHLANWHQQQQLQQHHQQQDLILQDSRFVDGQAMLHGGGSVRFPTNCPPYNSQLSDGGFSARLYHQTATEHLYESPNFERKEFGTSLAQPGLAEGPLPPPSYADYPRPIHPDQL